MKEIFVTQIVEMILAAHTNGFIAGLKTASELKLECKPDYETENGSAAHLRTQIKYKLSEALDSYNGGNIKR